MVPTPPFVDSVTVKSTYEPVDAPKRQESVDVPIGMVFEPPAVDETPVARLELYGPAVPATVTVDLNVNETDEEVPPEIEAVIVGDSAVASVTLIQAIPEELKFAADRFQA